MKSVNFASSDFAVWFAGLEQRRLDEGGAARAVADSIIADVRVRGDEAVSAALSRLDSVNLAAADILIRVEHAPEIDAELKDAIDEAIERVEDFHRAQRPEGFMLEKEGTILEHRVRALRRIGAYVPGGRAVYLSTLIMCAVPARIAGVEEIVVATTPRAAARPELQYVCARLGIREVYRCGGAAGVAALALGTGTLRRVDKIVGPGNAYVTAAKQALSAVVGIDMVAGPTEVVIIADESSDPRLVAADLLAQAEHGSDSTAICVTDSERFASALEEVIATQLDACAEDSAARTSIPAHACIINVADMREAVSVANMIAPEHVSVQAGSVDLDAIDNCGAIFVGRFSPVALGDYILGPNHVLPTGGAARFSSPLGVYDFVKRSNRITTSAATFSQVASKGALLARFEGLPLHGESIAMRQYVEVPEEVPV